MNICSFCGGDIKVIKDKPYHYDECGLDVTLCGVTQYECTECEETYVSLPNIQQLHRIIGAHICEKGKALLQPEEIRFLRKDLHMRAKQMARVLGTTPQALSRWENGRKPIGETHDRLFRAVYMMYASEPTAFMQWATQHNVTNISDGLGMLVGQAAESFNLWRGVRPSVAPVIQSIQASM